MVLAIVGIAVVVPRAASAQQTWAQQGLLDDDITQWPPEVAALAGVGSFGDAAERHEAVARAAAGEAAAVAWERAIRGRLVLGEEGRAYDDLDAALVKGAQQPAASSRTWAAVELVGAVCERDAERAEGLSRLLQWRRCAWDYHLALARLSPALPLDVEVRAAAAIARSLWHAGDDVGARAAARRALRRWRVATREAVDDPLLDQRGDMIETRLEVLRSAVASARRTAMPLYVCAERWAMRHPVSREAARERCAARLGLAPGGGFSAGGMGYPEPAVTERAFPPWPIVDATERAREAVGALRFEMLRRSAIDALAEFAAMDARESVRRVRRDEAVASGGGAPAEGHAWEVYWAQRGALNATASSGWSRRASVLDAALRLPGPATRDRPVVDHVPFRETAEWPLRGALPWSTRRMAQRCLHVERGAFDLRLFRTCLDAIERIPELWYVSSDREILPSLGAGPSASDEAHDATGE